MERSPSKRRDVLPEGWWSAETCWSLDPDECTFELSDEAKDHWNANVLPVVPEQGSLGASGDLAPLAHMVLPLIGMGEVKMPDGRRLPSGEALAELGWEPLELGPKEGRALINGTQMMLGMGMGKI